MYVYNGNVVLGSWIT